MHRKFLLDQLSYYTPWDEREQEMWENTLAFVRDHPTCFSRDLLEGHITGSAWIVSPCRRSVVLIHHKKLNRWFQPGGHSDNNPNTSEVAMREAMEETGLRSLKLLGKEPFDIDIHLIPEKGATPAHCHFDVRYLFEASLDESPVVSEESNDVVWTRLEQALIHNPERSIERMVEKTRTAHFLARYLEAG